MASLQTKIQIWNMALDRLSEQPLSSTADTSAPALWLSRNYDQQRDFLLQNTYLWKFAMDRASIAADGTTPAWGWANRFLLPTDCLRPVPPTVDGAWNGVPIPFEVEGEYLLCDQGGPLRLRYIKRVTNEGYFSNGFCEVLSLRLAMLMAPWLTGKASVTAAVQKAFMDTLAEVKAVNAVMVAQDTYYDTEILTARSTY